MSFLGLPELQPIATRLFEQYPVALSVSYVIAWCSGGLALFLYLFSPAGIESQIVKGARAVGLVATELRGIKSALPPEDFLRKAKSEILITGATAYRSFDTGKKVLVDALADSKEVYVVILAPDSSGAERLSTVEGKPISTDIYQVLNVIKNEPAFDSKAFHIRFVDELPPFTAVMLDGDVESTGTKPNDSGGIVRVQPRTALGKQGEGVIVQFVPTGKDFDGFKNFSRDLREQWKNAKDRPDLLKR